MTKEPAEDFDHKRFGQVTRRTGTVYLIWDLQAREGKTTHSTEHFQIGALIEFQIAASGQVIRVDHLSKEGLPEGVHPLIAVPTAGHTPPPPNDHSLQARENKKSKKVARG